MRLNMPEHRKATAIETFLNSAASSVKSVKSLGRVMSRDRHSGYIINIRGLCVSHPPGQGESSAGRFQESLVTK